MGALKNIEGQRFGNLLVVERTLLRSGWSYKYICLCDCGKYKITSSDSLVKGAITHCGCKRVFSKTTMIRSVMNSYINTGRRRNKKFNLNIDQTKQLILQNCYYCNAPPSNIWKTNISVQSDLYYNGIDRIDNNKDYDIDNVVTCCRFCNIAKNSLTVKEFYHHIHKINNYGKKKLDTTLIGERATGFKEMYHNYEVRITRKNKSFNLSKDEFYILTQNNCYYCGASPKNKQRNFIYNGIDRMDSAIGYELSNCVPCCKHCNVCKSTMSVNEFYDWVSRVINYQERNK